MKIEKVPMFAPFESIGDGFDRLFDKIKNIKNASDRTELLVIYGCLAQTINEQMNTGDDHAK
jgi:hypothetical protein